MVTLAGYPALRSFKLCVPLEYRSVCASPTDFSRSWSSEFGELIAHETEKSGKAIRAAGAKAE